METRVCNKCGAEFFVKPNTPCPEADCTGTMCLVVTPVVGKQLAGWLYRGKVEICFVPFACEQLTLSQGHYWTAKEWQQTYGKLPRKGSKTAVILEISNVQ